MLARRGGRIVNLITGTALMPIANMSAYLMSKVALIRFTELLALETSDRGIRAFAVNPGAVRTDMTEYLMELGRGAAVDALGTPTIRFWRNAGRATRVDRSGDCCRQGRWP